MPIILRASAVNQAPCPVVSLVALRALCNNPISYQLSAVYRLAVVRRLSSVLCRPRKALPCLAKATEETSS